MTKDINKTPLGDGFMLKSIAHPRNNSVVDRIKLFLLGSRIKRSALEYIWIDLPPETFVSDKAKNDDLYK